MYQEIEWRAYDENDDDNECMKPRNAPKFNTDYAVCMTSKLPSSNVGTFSRDPQSGSLTWLTWEDEKPRDSAKGYLSICEGDSGSGQWITNGEDEDNFNSVLDLKYVLIAVLTSAFAVTYDEPLYVHHLGPCGREVYFPDSDTYKWYATSSQRITSNEIFDWIKNEANIP